ncbi:hypothetical protein QE152_g22636 [Popillia japonica]|uniref:Craniofacial development protein 2 n=1 Tax=Popillia japonica TaxID=7064 RepID=A0AAW1KJU5_POPJA
MYQKITGGNSKHQQSNENGIRLITLAIEKDLKIMSTYFQRKEIHKGTWMIPGTMETNQIDHVLIQTEKSRLISNVRTYRGADTNSDHFLVGIKMKLPKTGISRKKKKYEIKYNIKELQDPEIAKKYRTEVEEIYKKHENRCNTVEKRWKYIEEAVLTATKRL